MLLTPVCVDVAVYTFTYVIILYPELSPAIQSCEVNSSGGHLIRCKTAKITCLLQVTFK